MIRVFALMTIMLLALPIEGFAQGKAAPSREGIEARYAEAATTILSSKVAPNEFDVSVSADLTPGSIPDEGYISSGLSAQGIAALPFYVLRNHLSSVKFTIELAPRHGAETKAWIQSILQKRLFLRPNADLIAFAPLLVIPPASVEADKARSELEEARRRLGALETARVVAEGKVYKQELDDARRKLTALESARVSAETKARSLQQESRDYKQKLRKQEQENTKLGTSLEVAKTLATTAAAGKTVSSLWDSKNKTNRLVIFGIGVLLALGLVTIGFAMLGSSRRIGDSLASGLGAIGQAFRREERNETVSTQTTTIMPGASQGEQTSSRPDLQSLPQIYELVARMRSELVTLVQGDKEIHVLEHVSWLLTGAQGDKSVPKAVASLELLGPQTANKFFHQLKNDDQMKILDFLRNGTYSIPKPVLMLEAGEELKTRLMGLQDAQVGTFNASPARLVLSQLEDDDILKLVKILPPQESARLISLVDPARSGRIMSALKEAGDAKFTGIIEQLPSLAEVASFEAIDTVIATAAKKLQHAADGDRRDAVLPFYKSLLSNVEDDVAEMIVTSLRRDPYFEEKIASRHVSLATFFDLALSVRFDVLMRLTPREIASFCFVLPEGRQRMILEALSERRRETILEDVEEMRGNSILGAKATREARLAKQKIVGVLRELERNGMNLKASGNQGQQQEFDAVRQRAAS